MNKRVFILIGLLSLCHNAMAVDVLPLDDALRVTYTACVGIDEEVSDLKKMAGINTAICLDIDKIALLALFPIAWKNIPDGI